MSQQMASGSSGTLGNQKTATTPGPGAKTARERKYERFLKIKERTKARKANTSQQFRLVKHPVSSAPDVEHSPPPATRQEEPMEVDVTSPGTTATPETEAATTTAGQSGRDEIDVYLDSPAPSLDEPDDEQPFFRETPPSSPHQPQ